MSLILKGIDRPERGETLNIKITDNGMVWVTKKDGWDYYSGYAIQIPKNHGRLIDMDDSMIFHGIHKEYFEECKRGIFEAHGILEAEV